MPKVNFCCKQCGQDFSVFPAAVRNAEQRGSEIKFCSRNCTDAARSAKKIGTKKRRGAEVMCAVCGSVVYRSPDRLREGRVYTCSEACRVKAHEDRLIDRSDSRPQRLKGETIVCCICGDSVYRKKSMIERNISKTCGKATCLSAHHRALWGLPPLTEMQKTYKKGPSRRATNFTAKQRAEWIGANCVRCGATENLCLDHIIPVSAGGKSSFSNAQTLCQPCNIWKSNHEDRPLALAFKQSQSGGLFG